MSATFLGRIKMTEDGSLPALRVGHLLHFLTVVERSTQCPLCPYNGGWEISMNPDPHEEDQENPELAIFQIPSLAGIAHSAAGMTCPNCGHLSFISTYKIRQFLDAQEQQHG